jgi:creatinine amidohydrolase
MARLWHRFETLRPDELRAVVAEAPVLYWPLGLLEHHGWHLPVGYDGIKADRLAARCAAATGGVVLPVMWWGCTGGHEPFAWTFYQDRAASEAIFRRTLERAATMGFRVITVVAGHYPWQHVIDDVVPELASQHPDILFLAGTELRLGEVVGVEIGGDHAARWETTYGLALLPELVDMDALTPGHEGDWPTSDRPDPDAYPGLDLDPASPLFGQLGEDPRVTADAAAGERLMADLAAAVATATDRHLGRDDG